jgi:hypothetical protein
MFGGPWEVDADRFLATKEQFRLTLGIGLRSEAVQSPQTLPVYSD